jgi:hypothetical protein
MRTRIRKPVSTVVVPALGVLLGGVFLWGVLPAAAETMAQKNTRLLEVALRKRIQSPGGKMEVKIVPGAHAAQGIFQEVYVSAVPAQIKRRRFSELVLSARNVKMDMAQLSKGKLETISSQTKLRAIVTENELSQALARGRESADKNIRVKFQNNGTVRVTGDWKWGWFSGPVEAIGKLRLGPNYTVVADISTLKLNGTIVPAPLKNKFQERINPLVDYKDLPFRPPFKSLRFIGSKAYISA